MAIAILSDDSIAVGNQLMRVNVEQNLSLGYTFALVSVIHLVGHYVLTSKKHWLSLKMAVMEFCSTHSVAVNGILVPVAQYQRILVALSVLQSAKLMRSDIRLMRVIALLVEAWMIQFDLRQPEEARLLPMRMLKLAQRLLLQMGQVKISDDVAAYLDIQLLSLLGTFTVSSSIERFLQIEYLDYFWFRHYYSSVAAWRLQHKAQLAVESA